MGKTPLGPVAASLLLHTAVLLLALALRWDAAPAWKPAQAVKMVTPPVAPWPSRWRNQPRPQAMRSTGRNTVRAERVENRARNFRPPASAGRAPESTGAIEIAPPEAPALAPPALALLPAATAFPERPAIKLGNLDGVLSGVAPGPSRSKAARVQAVFGSASTGPAAAPAEQGLRASGFGRASYGTGHAAAKPVSDLDPASPVEILFKPEPEYTEEARRLRLEGEVVLEVRFTARGSVEVLRVVRGLGHGLDEAAVQAARSIRFRPAVRSGMPVDAAGQVRILFQLAY